MTTSKWPCMFAEPFTREQVDPRVQAAWKEKFGVGAPFGALRSMWRQRHCRTLNHWSSDDCPYAKTDCALAFLRVAETSIYAAKTSPRGWFRSRAHGAALERIDTKPLARDNRTDGPQRPSDAGAQDDRDDARSPGDADSGDRAADSLSRARARPVPIGDLLGSLNLRPREDGPPNGEESTK